MLCFSSIMKSLLYYNNVLFCIFLLQIIQLNKGASIIFFICIFYSEKNNIDSVMI